MSRSRCESMIRQPVTPAALQPNPMHMVSWKEYAEQKGMAYRINQEVVWLITERLTKEAVLQIILMCIRLQPMIQLSTITTENSIGLFIFRPILI